MIYFVTGATGFIGKRLVARLSEKPRVTVYFPGHHKSAERLDAPRDLTYKFHRSQK